MYRETQPGKPHEKITSAVAGDRFVPAAFSQGGSGIDWAADLDYLASELPAKHCNLFAKYDKAQFETAIGAIKASAGEAGDFATALKTQQLIARLGDSHTMLYFNQLMNRQQNCRSGCSGFPTGCTSYRRQRKTKSCWGTGSQRSARHRSKP